MNWKALFVTVSLGSVPASWAAEPIRLHPDNPHYFLWRGKPTVLITAGEHYGAVLNLDFDYQRYLDELKSHRFNLTRVFSGIYREVPGSFNITGNTLAPVAERFICPWARSDTPGASDGGNKFDLNQWDQAYFRRLKNFLKKAGECGVVAEVVFFCTMYDDKVWDASPMNARNNVQGIGNVGKYEVYNAKDRNLVRVQTSVVRKLVTELNAFDNLYYEVCNEPYERGGLTEEWNDRIIAAIVETEAELPGKHLVAQGFPPARVASLNPHVSILNFHAGKPDPVRLNYDLNKVIAFDETGGSDRNDRKYRLEGWNFLFAGGGVYNHLDFSFTTARPDGTAVPLPPGTPGGGGPELRRQLRVFKEFIGEFDFVRMAPHEAILGSNRLAGRGTIRCLAEPGKAYAIYINGEGPTELVLDLPAGTYGSKWVNTKTGRIEEAKTFAHDGGARTLASPEFIDDIALSLKRQ